MRKSVLLGFAAAALLLWSVPAGAQDVTRDWDKSYNFATIRTFAVKIGTSWGNALSEERIRGDVTQALAAKGWTAAPEDSADAIVVLHGATDTKHSVSTFYDGWGGWGYYGGGGMGSSTTMVSDYKVGTLVADIFDAKTKKLIYRGSASDEISDNPSKNVSKGTKAVQKMFKDFPPKEKAAKKN